MLVTGLAEIQISWEGFMALDLLRGGDHDGFVWHSDHILHHT